VHPTVRLNPDLDIKALADEFESNGRLQVHNVLTTESAIALRSLLADQTPWCLATQAGASAPAQVISNRTLCSMSDAEVAAASELAAADPDYGFTYHSYPLVTAYLERWSPGSPHERLLEDLNSPPMLGFMRAVTGMNEIVKMDGQATLYSPGEFLRPHTDAESQKGRLVAYVLGLTAGEWDPAWGGALRFIGGDGDSDTTFQPTFNSLSLFRVPQWHEVTRVRADAPIARYAVTGWARDR